MVYIPVDRYEEAYQRILSGAHKTNHTATAAAAAAATTTVVVFASIDADSICGLRILTSLFKRDSVGHKVIPVTNYADIQAAGAQVASRQTRTLVFLNCGGQVDIQDLVALRDDLVVVIIDSHRPLNLYNVYWNEQVLCLDDGDVEGNMGALRSAFEDIEFGSDVNASDNESEDEEEDDDDDDEEGAARAKRRNSSTGSGDAEEVPRQARKKRRRAADMDPDEFIQMQRARARKREQRAQNQQLIQAYYTQGSYYGQSCALSALVLSEQLGIPPSPDHVWWATVGATSQYVLQLIDADGYAVVVARMRDLVKRVSANSSNGSSSNGSSKNGGGPHAAASSVQAPRTTGAADPQSSSSQMPLDSQLEGDGAPPSSVANNIDLFNPYLDMPGDHSNDDDEGYAAGTGGAVSAAAAGRLTSSRTIGQQTEITESSELKFPLLRHWSLSEAMRFSPYVATRLATWSSKGRARLDLLLAKLGLSKAEADAPFLHLAPDLKALLRRKMGQIGSDYDMPDAAYPGFVRNYGWRKANVSASDMVLALLALLLPSASPDTATHMSHGFYAAYDALAQYDTLRLGIGGALDLQRLVVGQGLAMLERQAVKTLRSFRLAMLGDLEMIAATGADGQRRALSAFGSPFVLRQLALFLMQTLRERSRKTHARLPFIIAAPCKTTTREGVSNQNGNSLDDDNSGGDQRLLVLGITPLDYSLMAPPRSRDGAVEFSRSTFAGESRNHFGLVFEQVAADIGADVRQGFFDSSALEIGRSDMSAFIDKLRRHL
ncbi:DNA replication initiation factor cdc45 [Coemansia sp. RSA 1200]|nr:DNA replication initiation factor cdc45 [Coemansia sp. RSA 1200]